MAALTLLCAFLLLGACTGLQVLSPSEYAGQYSSPTWRWSPANFAPITGNATYTDPINGCKEFSNADKVRGRIAIAEVDGCSYETIVRNVQAAGGLALILAVPPGVAGKCYICRDSSDKKDIIIPIVELDTGAMTDAVKAGKDVLMVITANEPNPWADKYESGVMLAFRIVIGGWSLLLVGAAIYRLFVFVSMWQGKVNLPMVVLSIEIISLCLRIPHVIGNPFQTNDNLTFTAARFLGTIHIPFLLVNSILVIIFWYELTKSRPVQGLHIIGTTYGRIVLGISAGLMFVFEVLAGSVAAAYYNSAIISILEGVFYAIYCLMVAIGYLVIATRLVMLINSLKQAPDAMTKRIKNMTNLLRVQAVLMIIAVIGSFLTASAFYNEPGFYVGIWWFLYSLMSLVSSIQIYVLKPVKQQTSTSGSASGGSMSATSTTSAGSASASASSAEAV